MSMSEAERFGVSDEYWSRLSEKDQALYREIRPLRKSAYEVSVPIARIESTLAQLDADARLQGGELELIPDFQRGHVWTQDKQIAFMEAVARGIAPLVIRFNSPGWLSLSDGNRKESDLNPHSIQCIDGLQRLTAMREFVAGKFKIFNHYTIDDLDNTSFSFKRIGMMWNMEMFTFQRRADLLQFYLDLNSGGVVHSDAELDRVRALKQTALEGQPVEPVVSAPRRRAPRG